MRPTDASTPSGGWFRRIVIQLVVLSLVASTVVTASNPSHAAAAETLLSSRYSGATFGDVELIGNAIVTCDTSLTACQTQLATGSPNGNGTQMFYIDVDGDGTTFNSSSADLSLPVGATVDFAALYWAGTTEYLPVGDLPNRPNVKLSTPASGGYVSLSGTLLGDTTSNDNAYSAYTDVTSLVQAGGNGTYTLADMTVDTGVGSTGPWGGWSMAVVYSLPSGTCRSVNIYDGLDEIFFTTETITLAGLNTPGVGPVGATLGAFVGDGEADFNAQLLFEGTPLSNAVNPSTNFFNNTVSDFGTSVTTRYPNPLHNLVVDVDTADATGLLSPGDTAADLSVVSNDEGVWWVAATMAIAIECRPEFGIEKTGPAAIAEGGTANYTITVTNDDIAGDGSPIANVAVSDPEIASLTFQGGDDNGNGLLEVGESWVYTGSRVITGLDPDPFINTATVTGQDGEGDAVQATDQHSVDVAQPADLAVTKIVSAPSAMEGGSLSFTIDVTNAGPATATGVEITDVLPSGVAYTSSSATSGSYNPGTGVWSVGTIAVSGSAQLTIDVTGTTSGSYTNTAEVTAANEPDTDSTPGNGDSDEDDQSSVTFDITDQIDLTATKIAGITGPVQVGDTIPYTIEITNSSGVTQTGIRVSDAVPSGTSYVAESTTAQGYEVATASVSNSYSDVGGVAINSATTCTSPIVRTIDVTDNITLTDVNLGFNADHAWRGDIQVTLESPTGTRATVVPTDTGDWADNYDILLDDASSNPLDDGTADTTASPFYDRLVGTGGGLTGFNGEAAAGTWRIEICDTYPPLDDGVYNRAELYLTGDATVVVPSTKDNVPGGATSDLSDGSMPDIVVAADGFVLEPGTTMTVTFDVVVGATLDGTFTDIENTAEIRSDQQSTTATDATNTLAIDFQPIIDIVKSGPAGPVSVGQSITYTYTVTHDAASDMSQVDITVDDDIVGAISNLTSGDTDGDALLDGGETWVFEETYTVPVDAADPLVNVATVTGTDADGEAVPKAQDQHSVDVEFQPVITVDKVGSPVLASIGDTVSYTYTVAHDAGSDGSAVSAVSVVDSRGLTLSGPTGDTNSDGFLDGGETWVYTATEVVTTATPDPLTNDVTVDGTDRDGDAVPQATDSESVDIDFAPDLQVTKSGPSAASVGQTITYTFMISHTGASDSSPATITGVADDVAGAATYVSGDTNSDGLLDGGETWTYTATYTVQATDPNPLVNVVTVTAVDEDGDPVTDTDSHSTAIDYNPIIDIAKSGPATADVNDVVTYTFTVGHDVTSDGSPISAVSVTDDIAGAATYVSGDTNSNGLLETGETWTYEATYTVLPTDPTTITNTGTATGTDGDGDTITASDTHTTEISFTPVIEIAKSGPTIAAVGDTVTYTFDVFHGADSDDSPVSAVSVSDDIAGAAAYVSGDTNGNGLLEAGETWTFEATYTIQATDPDPLVNTGTVTGTDTDGDPVTATDTHSTNVLFAPTVEVVKSGPATATVGDTVIYTFSVTHGTTSDGSPISAVSVTDDIAGAATYTGGDDGDGLLADGETWTFEATYTVLPTDPDPLINTATASGTDPDGDPVTDTDTHSTDIGFAPVLDITKSGPATAAVGDTVIYTFTVGHDTTSDGSPIFAVSVTDDVAGAATYVSGDTNTDGLLADGETWTFEVSYMVLTTDPDEIVNTATATGTNRDGDPITDTDTHTTDVEHTPTIAITKSGPATASVGDTVTYTFTVTHDTTSDGSPITMTGVTDDIAGAATYTGGDDGNGLLETGETWTYEATYTVLPTDPDPLINTATASGTDPDGDPVTDTDTHSTDIDYNPIIDVAKSGPATAAVGDTVTYTFTVGHDLTSDGSPISAVSVTDDVAGAATYVSGDTNSNGLLEAGETWTYEASYTFQASDPDTVTNAGTATGTDPDGDPTTDTDTHTTDVEHTPVIDTSKSGPTTASVGDTVTYTFTVGHDATSDGSPITMTSVTDDVAGAATYTGGDDGDGLLETGETWTYEATYTVLPTDPDPLINTATASGTDPDGDPITDTDSHSTAIDYNPIIDIAKSGPATADVNDVVTYTFTVGHDVTSDGSPISAVSVTDDIAGAATYVSGDTNSNGLLETGETWTYEATYTVLPTDPTTITNTGTATGTDGDGDTITASDTHDLAVTFSPVLEVTKSGPATAAVGDTVSYTFTVTHDATSDGSPISAVSVTDDIAGAATYTGGDDGDALLEPGETWQFSVDYVLAATDADPLVNVATASGNQPGGGTVTDTDTHSLDVEFQPEIEIVKSGLAIAAPGQDITYTFTVGHGAGSDGSAIGSVTVSDSLTAAPTFVGGDDGDGLLENGETWTYQVTRTVLATDPDPLINTATALGTDRDGDPVTDTDSHSTMLDYAPALQITKSGAGTAGVGDSVTYTFAVTHSAASDGSPITMTGVTDDIAGAATYTGGDDGSGLLEAGETWTYEATYTIQPTDPNSLTNTATASGLDSDGDVVTSQDTHTMDIEFEPAIQVAKSGPANAAVGDTVTYTFTVTHDTTSDGSPITMTGVTDDIAGAATYTGGDDGNGLLETGETWTYEATYTVLPTDPDPLINTATASGTDPDGDPITDTDSHSTAIDYNPAVAITKSGPATAAVGDTVTYTFAVTHDATSDGSDVSVADVTDDIAGPATYTGGDDGDGLLETGETWTYEATYTVLPTDPDPLINTATASGTDPDGDPITDTDTHSTDLGYTPALEVVKAGPALAGVGDTVTYTFTVGHDATSDGSPITMTGVTDDIAGPATYVSGDTNSNGLLETGETWTYEATYTVLPTDPDPLINTATASGTDPDGGAVTDTDTHALDVEYQPALNVVKTGPALGSVGDTVTYTFTVTHDATSDGSPITMTGVTDNVAGPATYASGDTNADGILQLGESWSFSVDYIISPADSDPLVNTAMAAGTDEDGDAVTATDTHSMDVEFNPEIQIVKSGPATVGAGDTATYTFEVSHAAGSDGSNVDGVTVTDDIAGVPTRTGGDDGDDILEAGETWVYSVDYVVAVTDPDPLVNTATVSGTDNEGDSVSATDVHSAAVEFDPVIEIVKTGPATAGIGETVTYTFSVSHDATSDDSPVTMTSVTDDITGPATYTGGDTNTDGLLDAGETWTYEATYTITDTDPDPLVNTAIAAGTDRDGETITDTDSHSLDIDYQPLLDVVKSGPATATVGENVTYTFDVSHAAASDGTTVSALAVVDDVAGPAAYVSGDDGDGVLEPGETWSFEAAYTVLTTDSDPLVNTATASGVDRDAEPVSDTDTHSTDIEFTPAIDVTKNGPSTANIGDTVTYTFAVTHDATSDGSDVSVADVTDDIAGPATYTGGDDGDGLLEVGETWTYEATYTIQAADSDPLVNTVIVNAADRDGDPLSATDTHSLDIEVSAAIEIVKSGPATAAVGDAVTYTFEVSHAAGSDGSPIAAVSVSDDIAGAATYVGGDDGDTVLEAGETWTYEATYTVLAGDPSSLLNTATASGTDAHGGTVSDTDTHTTAISHTAAIAVVKSGPATAAVGDAVTYTFDISHGAGSDGSPVTVDSVVDDVAGAASYVSGDDGDGLLEGGEVWTYTAGHTVSGTDPDPLVNTVTATGTDLDGDSLTATDSHSLDIVNGSLEVTKTPDTQTVVSGGDATFTITVANTGDVDLINIVVSDPLTPACDATIGTLAAGGTNSYTCAATGVSADFTNIATAAGEDPLGNPVSDTDGATVDVIAPSVDVQKDPGVQNILSGADASFTITVANTGDVDLTNIVVSDPLTPACDTAIASLPVGASATVTCTANTVGADFTNTVTVFADDPLGNQVSDTDTATVDVITPAIDLEKTPDTQSVLSGDDATFTITVTNTGDVGLSNVVVTDPLTASCDLTIGSLAAGATSTYTCTAAAPTSGFTNTASVTADHPAGGTVTDTDDATVNVIAPAISISKTPDTQSVVSGGDATFTVEVSNTGDAELSNVVVSDANAPGCATTIASLVAGASTSVTCTVSGITSHFTNTATVVADHAAGGTVTATDNADVVVLVPGVDIQKTPDIQTVVNGGTATFTITVTNTSAVDLSGVTVSDPLVPACDAALGTLVGGASSSYTCDASGLTADFTNTADVTATDPLGGVVSDGDTAVVDVIAPAIQIDKSPDTQAVVTGDDATFSIAVSNTGDVDLTNVVVTDPLAPACDTTIATLAAGTSATVSCTVSGVTSDFTNTADVTAEDPLANPVSASDSADVTVLVPSIEVQKTPDIQTVGYSGTATFTITVTNTGETDLTNIVVADALAPTCDTTITSLAIGATTSYTCDLADVTASLTNTANVTAEDPLGNPVADSDSADVNVITPVIDIEKTPDLQTVLVGGDATFTITLTNTGDAALSSVVVTDPLAPACDATFASMAPGEVQTYTCTLSGVTSDLTNTATADAVDPLGRPLSDSDTADVTVITPGIDVQKTPDAQTILTGGDATFSITVTNTGDVDLTDVAVTDPAAPVCDAAIGDLPIGASHTYDCTVSSLTSDLTNIAQAIGTDPLANTLNDSDDAFVDVIAPGLSISKTPDDQAVVQGGAATFGIEVSNTGDVDLTNVVVSDPNAPACDTTLGTLAAGTSSTVTCSVAGVATDFTNTASVSGDDPLGNALSASDTAAVTVLVPAIDIQKTPDIQTVSNGGDATFTITVANTGATPLTNITVSDPLAPACDTTLATLAAGETHAYSCLLAAVVADFTNTADVTADDPTGNTITASDDAIVDVIAPAVQISKTPDNQAIVQGGDATFSIEIANVGDVDLFNVTITDPAVPACDTAIGTLAAGSSTTVTCSAAGVTADFTNTAEVTAEDVVGTLVTGTDTADVTVLVPDIDVQKTPDVQTVIEGETATFTISVTNSGATPLANVVIDDPLLPSCDATIASLAVGATQSHTCSTTASASFTNTVSVTAEDPEGGRVTATDTADLVVTPVGDASGHLFIDSDGDGVQDPGEPDLAGIDVTITLPDGSTTIVTTNAGGDWILTDIPIGDIAADVDEGDADFPADHMLSTANDPQHLTVTDAGVATASPVGYAPPATITGVAWHDTDGDGIQDASEPPLEGIVVTLWQDSDGDGHPDTVAATTTTLPDGTYMFDGLEPGDYQVRFSFPAPLTPTVADRGSDDSVDSDVDAIGHSQLFPLSAGEALSHVDGGAYAPVTIGDLVWSDTDGDGAMDPGEPGAGGVDVTATWAGPDGVIGTADDREFTTITATDGSYSFTGLAPGTYEVTIAVPTGAELTFGDTPYLVQTTSGSEIDTADFGLAGTTRIEGIVWLDLDHDGDLDPDEPTLGGTTVTATWAGTDGIFGNGDDVAYTLETDGSGNYSIDGLPSGEYELAVDTSTVPAGLTATYDLDGVADSTTGFTAAPGETVTDVDFGYGGWGSIGGTVWLDVDGDSTLDAGEPGFEGADVRVIWAGLDGEMGTADDVVFDLLTDADGAYSVGNLPPGEYGVAVDESTVPQDYEPSFDIDGGNDSRAIIALTPGASIDDINFGYQGTADLGDQVWIDEDGDGVFDPGEDGVADATVRVTWAGPDGILGNDDDVVFETTTDTDGTYFIEDLPPGRFEVEVLSDSVPGNVPSGPVQVTLIGGAVNLDGDIPVTAQATTQPPPAASQPTLPQTGIDSDELARTAIALVGLGAWLVVLARRREQGMPSRR